MTLVLVRIAELAVSNLLRQVSNGSFREAATQRFGSSGNRGNGP